MTEGDVGEELECAVGVAGLVGKRSAKQLGEVAGGIDPDDAFEMAIGETVDDQVDDLVAEAPHFIDAHAESVGRVRLSLLVHVRLRAIAGGGRIPRFAYQMAFRIASHQELGTVLAKKMRA